MADDKQMLTTLTTKQKAVAGGVVVVMLIVIWQVIGMFKGSGSAPPVQIQQKPVTQMNAGAPNGAGNMSQNPNGPMMQQPQPMAMNQQAQQIQPKAAPVAKDIELLRLQQETQAKYIGALNDLQMLRLQRDIAETNQAIMQAKLATVTAEKHINDLLTVKQQQPGMISSSFVSGPTTGPTSPPPLGQVVDQGGYTVVSVSYELGRWHAVMNLQGKMYNITVGDTLPLDGSVVTAISRAGVTIEKEDKKRIITLVGAI